MKSPCFLSPMLTISICSSQTVDRYVPILKQYKTSPDTKNVKVQLAERLERKPAMLEVGGSIPSWAVYFFWLCYLIIIIADNSQFNVDQSMLLFFRGRALGSHSHGPWNGQQTSTTLVSVSLTTKQDRIIWSGEILQFSRWYKTDSCCIRKNPNIRIDWFRPNLIRTYGRTDVRTDGQISAWF